MSVLNKTYSELDAELTTSILKRLGYSKINWGAPDRSENGNHYWDKQSEAWEKIIGLADIVYFPKDFHKPVNSSILGCADWKTPKYAVLAISNLSANVDSVFEENIHTIADLKSVEMRACEVLN